jgi:decaprenyl-diphosphate synthase subunit 2
MRSTRTVDLMAKAIGDFMEGQFIIETESQYPEDNATAKYWEERNFLRVGSLQANSCQSALALAGHEEEAQEKAYEFGKNFALAWHAFSELRPFTEPYLQLSNTVASFELMSAPILLHIQETGESLDSVRLQAKEGNHDVDYKRLHGLIRSGTGIEKTQQLILSYSDKALDALDYFPASDAIKALQNLVYAVRERQEKE